MLFRPLFLSILLFILSPCLLADIDNVDYSDDITLASVTDAVYNLLPQINLQSSAKQQINANSQLANALFAGPSTIVLVHQNDVVGSDAGLQESEGGIEFPLWLKGQKQQYQDLSLKMSAELAVYNEKLRLDASGQVRSLVWDVALADLEVKQAKHAWSAALQLDQDVKTKVAAGELAEAESLLIQTEIMQMHGHYLTAIAKRDYAFNRYVQLTGQKQLPIEHEETLVDIISSDKAPIQISEKHPELSVLAQQIITLGSQQKLANYQAAINPNLYIGVKRERNDRSEDFINSIGLGLSFPLDGKVYRQPAVASAAKAIAEVEVNRQQRKIELEQQLRQMINQLKIKQQQQSQMIEQATTIQSYLTSQQRAFDLGEIDLLSLLRSRQVANDTLNRKQRLEVEIKRSIAQVNQAYGIIL